MNDPGSLGNLNDIVLPGPVSWWPPAPGWYAVIAVALVLTAWALFRGLKAWRQNTYRREALRELSAIRRRGIGSAREIPVLLKRAALSVWPRERVASLTGHEWHAFLDESAGTGSFSGGVGKILDRLSRAASGDCKPNRDEFDRVCTAAERWLKGHRVKEN